MSTDIELGALLRRMRNDRGEPLRVVAAAAGIDSTLLSRIERGERLPTARQIEALAEHFVVPVEDLRPMGNAARMMRTWSSAEEVLRAADVIERQSGLSRPSAALRTTEGGIEASLAPSGGPRRATPASGPALETFRADVHSLLSPPAPKATRADRLEEIAEAAAAGDMALEILERATHERDSVVALRATELLRQLRERLR